ncbi:hypothetical protein AYO39_00260 [Actinobacteria bacterium SCGC AG-212-D09]|nr:hypothetical protein AYO39_00260 [Actinobacteria bacterium SCGC AG-212-D09]
MAIKLEAWGETIEELAAEQAQSLAEAGLVTVQIHEPPDSWRLIADSRIGIVAGEGLEVRVSPALDIPKLMFLLSYAADPRGWRDAIAAFSADPDLFAAIASGFAFQAERALSPAPIRGYITAEEQSTTLRGRLRFPDQIARWPGLPVPLEISYDDYTADIAENRLVRGAAELLLRFPRIPVLARKRLLRVRATLEEVTSAQPGPDAEAPQITRLNDRYGAALTLAELILKGTSISTFEGKVSSVAFVFDMNKVFEDFLSASLRRALQSRGGQVQLQYGREHLDLQRRIRLIPDISWWLGSRCAAVIDAKYKPLEDARFPNADAYQMLAYCTAFGLSHGYLVYARDALGNDRQHRVRNGDVTIDVSAIDVELDPDLLLEQVERLARRIVATGQAGHDQPARAVAV